MPKVTFVNEHRVVEVDAGRTVHEVAREAGIVLGRQCFLEPSAPDAVTARTWIESLRGARGTRRLPSLARVLGDVKVYSMPAASSRVRVDRAIDAPPMPTIDPGAARKPDDAASTAAHVYGHPTAIGRSEVVFEKPHVPEAPPSRPNAARPASAYPPPPSDEDDGAL